MNICTTIILCPLFGLDCTVLIQSTVYSLTMTCNMYFGNFLNGLINRLNYHARLSKYYTKKNGTRISNYTCIKFMKAYK